jgi:hypothetical protein
MKRMYKLVAFLLQFYYFKKQIESVQQIHNLVLKYCNLAESYDILKIKSIKTFFDI